MSTHSLEEALKPIYAWIQPVKKSINFLVLFPNVYYLPFGGGYDARILCIRCKKVCAARRASVCESRGNIMAVVNVFSAFQAHVVLMAGCYYRGLLPSLHQLFDQLMYNILLLLRVQRHAAVSLPNCFAETCTSKMSRTTSLHYIRMILFLLILYHSVI